MNVRVAGVEICVSDRDRTWERPLDIVWERVADCDGVNDERARADGYGGSGWRVTAMIHWCCGLRYDRFNMQVLTTESKR